MKKITAIIAALGFLGSTMLTPVAAATSEDFSAAAKKTDKKGEKSKGKKKAKKKGQKKKKKVKKAKKVKKKGKKAKKAPAEPKMEDKKSSLVTDFSAAKKA